ncbi:hypothetical protein D3C71_963150 [compost metagenome]
MFRANAERQLRAFKTGARLHRHGNCLALILHRHTFGADGFAGDLQEIHFRIADETGDKHVRRLVVKLERRANLGDFTTIQHHDAVSHGHGFHLVVRHIDHRRL